MLTNGISCAIIGNVPKKTEYADVAHLVERHLAKVEVASSSLVVRSTKPLQNEVVFLFSPLNNPKQITRWGVRSRAKEYAAVYRQFYARYPYAGFGNMFIAWAKDPEAGNNRSYANGGAMRAVPIGYAYDSLEQVLLQAKAACIPTHNHREAVCGAQAVAAAVFMAGRGESKTGIKAYLEKTFRYDLSTSLEKIREQYVFDSRASYSVPPAIAAFLASSDYESAVRNAVSLGGDADTQACIAGGIAEAYYKEIPEHIKRFCDSRIDISIKSAVKEFNRVYC